MTNFSDLTLNAALGENLRRHNFVTPTPVQAGAIPPALEGRDVVATAQTGTGKTLAFALPLVERLLRKPAKGARAVILSPTRELAQQIEATLLKLLEGTKLRTALVVGGMNEQRQLRQLKAGAEIIVATPGRFEDFLRRRLLRLEGVEAVVLDEADRMLDMGFLPSIREILSACPSQRQTLLFSATIEKSVAHLIADYVQDPVRIAIGATTKTAEQVDLVRYEVAGIEKLPLLLHLLDEEDGSFLVFSRTKHGADNLADKLKETGVDATRIHGNRTQAQRNQALEGFKRGDYRVLVATDVAARGIHVDGIAHVVNFDLPQAPEDFIHRVGRTARAGARGTASTFFTKNERGEMRRIERTIGMPIALRDLPKLKPRTRMEAVKFETARFETPKFEAPKFEAIRPQAHRPEVHRPSAHKPLPTKTISMDDVRAEVQRIEDLKNKRKQRPQEQSTAPAPKRTAKPDAKGMLKPEAKGTVKREDKREGKVEAKKESPFAERHFAQKQKAHKKLKAKKVFQKKVAFAKRKKLVKG
ncbi:MAG: DEAD/DEAH box helicase [Bryobacter sp.]|nr:DEAD/DEAH box helicase [Bryobacter sp.]